MIDINEMQQKLETLITDSKLDKLFKPGKIKTQDKKLPHWVSMRLKLHNPYTLTEFVIIEKKSGLKFSIHHTKDLPYEVKKFFLSLNGAADNSNTIFDFDFENSLDTAKSIVAFFLKDSTINLCNASNYKPVKILKEENENSNSD